MASVAALVAGVVSAMVLGISASRADPGAAGPTPHPTLGSLSREAVLMGAATGGEPGESWAYLALPKDVPPPGKPGRGADFAPSQGSPFGQLVLLRYTNASGVWTVQETPRTQSGTPYRGFSPNPLSARITPHGGGVLVGSDPTAPTGGRVVVLSRDPGGRFTVLPQPPATVVHPASAGVMAETLATGEGTGRVAAEAVEVSGHTELYAGILGPSLEAAVAHWDGKAWTREPVIVPGSASASFRILAVAATSPENAWLLGQEDAAAGSGVTLYHRVQGAAGPEWDRAKLPATTFDAAATASRGITGVAALAGQAQPLTVSASTVWVDLRFNESAGGGHGPGGTQFNATVAYDLGAGSAATFCDAHDTGGGSVCGHGLGFRLDAGLGYRSFAFSGAGLGSRVVTDILASPARDGAVNDGSYARFQDTSVSVLPGGAPSLQGGAAFSSPTQGWLPGPVQIVARPAPQTLTAWPLQARSPLTGVAPEPGTPAGSLAQHALAVGTGGVVERFTPRVGWQREYLLTSSGAVSSPNLRAVAWPEPGRAYAVGDLGAMWLYRSETGYWEPDPAAPVDGFQANLQGVAFDPQHPSIGYAVGSQGTLLRYDKTWTQETVPASVAGHDFSSVAFAGGQALVAAEGDLLENSGGGWTVDAQVHALLATLPAQPTILTVAGLPDGGAIAAGHDVVLERDGPSSPWRVSDQPLPSETVVAAAALREGARVRAVVSVQPQIPYPPALPNVIPDPNSPPPLLPPNPLASSGFVLRESGGRWIDDEQTSYNSPTNDKPVKSDPIAGFDLGPDGTGWAVGGWSGQADESGRGSSASGSEGQSTRERVSTAGAYRYQPDGSPSPAPLGASGAPIVLPVQKANFLVAGHAACAQACADLQQERLAPDQNLTKLMNVAAGLMGQPGAPRSLLYTGGRVDSATAGLSPPDADRFAALFAAQPSVPVYPAVSPDISSGGNVTSFSASFSGFPAPFGSGPTPAGVSTSAVPGASPSGGVRTHYAFDSAGRAGTVRVVVIDNSRGSLAASDPYQNPAEAQVPWLQGQLADARQRGIPVVVMGSRDLNSQLAPQVNVASDADAEARLLAAGGASAYVFERPEEQRTSRVPAGGAATVPEYGTGSLGYRSPLQNTTQAGQPDALFGQTGYLVLSVDVAHRDPSTNVAPATATLQPLLQDLALQAVDGTLLRRSRPALFQALGRRPIAGDRWGPVSAGDATPNPPGADPYTTFPPNPCLQANCTSMINPQYAFKSSRPDIANFVKQDPNSQDLRKPLQGARGKPVADASSGLLCAFNAGTTSVTVTTGGLSASLPVKVLSGSVEQPCGTTPLLDVPSRQTTPAVAPPPPLNLPIAAVTPPPPPAAAPAAPPPAVARPALVPVAVKPAALPRVFIPPTPALGGLPPPQLAASSGVLAPPPPPAGAFARPIPPGGAVIRVYEEKREEEAAPEQSQAFAAYHPDTGPDMPLPPFILGIVLIGAAAGASVRLGLWRRDRRHEAAIAAASLSSPQQQTQRRYR